MGSKPFAAKLARSAQQATSFMISILDASTEYSIIATDLKGTILLWNEGSRRIYGYESAEIIEFKNIDILFPPLDRIQKKAEEIHTLALQFGKWEGLLKRYRKNGQIFPARVVITPRYDGEGNVLGLLVISKDVSSELIVEDLAFEELKATRLYTRSLVEANVDMLLVTDTTGIITDINQQLCKTLGYPRDEIIGIHFITYCTEIQRAYSLIKSACSGETVTNYELILRVRNDKLIMVSCNARALFGTDAQKRGVLITARDITEQKYLEAQLQRKNAELKAQNYRNQEADRLKSQFLANMSHELRTPLNAIIGFADLLAAGIVVPPLEAQKEYLEDILACARHLLDLINDTLDLSKVEAGKMTFSPKTLDLGKLMEELHGIIDNLAHQKQVHVNYHLDPAVREVTLDSSRIKQVLYNYLSNAIKFTPDGGNIQVRILPEGEEAFRIEVEDTGIGIRPEDIHRLFIAFQQLKVGDKRKYQGTGLGLALTRRIVEAQGGRVGVHSTPGEGSTFFAVLPRVVQEHEAQPTSALENGTLVGIGRPTVLVIEDNTDDLIIMSHLLSTRGFVVQIATTGEEALLLNQQVVFDLIAIDILLPDMDGIRLLEIIRNEGQNRDVPILLMTVLTTSEMDLRYPVQGILEKPIREEEFNAVLAQLHITRTEREESPSSLAGQPSSGL